MILIDVHAGNNGGEYGFYRVVSPLTGHFLYGTTSEIDYCSIYGGFQKCIQCLEWNEEEGRCDASYRKISDEMADMLSYFGWDEEVNCTGHDYDCGGCIECYPCNLKCLIMSAEVDKGRLNCRRRVRLD